MRRPLLASAMFVFVFADCGAQTVYPVDRAEILAGSRFDVKVELPGLVSPDDIRLTVNGADHASLFGKAAQFIEKEDGKDQSALVLRDVSLAKPGSHTVRIETAAAARDVTWTVYDTPARKAKNVVLLIGDGLSPAHRTAARLLSKGIAEGRAFGKLAMDDLPQMALVSTAGTDSIITDSANAASAYATGHKTAVNAMGVYADRSADPFDDPRVETIVSLAKRRNGMAVGIVSNTEIQDATPAAMIAHTRRRAAYDQIVEQYFAAQPDVLMGGGLANFLPQGAPGARRRDQTDYIAKFKDAGYAFASNAAELKAVPQDTRRLLGLFTPGNMDGVLDRKFLKAGGVKRFPDQPDLTEMTAKALDILSQNTNGFFLMVESGMIDKYTHLLDMERAVYDTILFDNVVRLVRDWAKARGEDTLILVLADHNHPVAIVGTIDDDMTNTPNVPMRERVRIYDKAGFPNYPSPDAEGYPSRVDVSRRLAMFSASLPDHYETFRPRLDDPNQPTTPGRDPGTFEANERYRNVPGAVLRFGNLPRLASASVHSGEDVILTASGPGSEAVRGQMENTDVFRVMAEALGLGAGAQAASGAR
ncbi:MAG: alkaline phosphatase [Pseudorhodoplanes sp.]|uniref:alkaline phosphatase n=1 Tax=Pseudorhodoplanes sp. TaxID=1934341 RepID=UPI003D11693B